MPLPDLLGTRRLRREIDVQSQQLEHDLERIKSTAVQLRQTAIARATSPLALACAVAAGFITGKVQHACSLPSNRITAAVHNRSARIVAGIATAALSALRAIGWQIVIPAVIEWARTKLQSDPDSTQQKTDH